MLRTWCHILCALFISLVASRSLGKSALNAMCYLEEKPGSAVQGTNMDSMYEIASVSKIVTSYWALSTLGPDYRFVTQVYVDQASAGTVDVHIEGGADPYFGREMTHFLFSELQRLGVKKIRDLTFDQNFKLFWSVREKPTWSIDPSRENIIQVLKQKINFRSAEYTATRLQSIKLGMKLEQQMNIKVAN
ncbi:MAG: hypothetical protein EOP06_15560, partial [Proteobacteria bacterium]